MKKKIKATKKKKQYKHTAPKSLNKDTYYTLIDLVSLKLFYYTSFSKVRSIVEKDRKGNNILNPVVSGRARGKKYLFKGENIIKFVNCINTGIVNLPPKTK